MPAARGHQRTCSELAQNPRMLGFVADLDMERVRGRRRAPAHDQPGRAVPGDPRLLDGPREPTGVGRPGRRARPRHHGAVGRGHHARDGVVGGRRDVVAARTARRGRRHAHRSQRRDALAATTRARRRQREPAGAHRGGAVRVHPPVGDRVARGEGHRRGVQRRDRRARRAGPPPAAPAGRRLPVRHRRHEGGARLGRRRPRPGERERAPRRQRACGARPARRPRHLGHAGRVAARRRPVLPRPGRKSTSPAPTSPTRTSWRRT